MTSRRDVIRSLALGVAGGSVLRLIPLEAAERVHGMIASERAGPAGQYAARFFSPHQYRTLQALCDTIIPADANAAGAVEAGAPEFIDLLTSENPDYQLRLGGGLMWLDAACRDRFGKVYLDCTTRERTEMLDRIAYRRNAERDADLLHGIECFAFLRDLTTDGFFTSKIGIEYLGYVGNQVRGEFSGCPLVPE